MIIWCVIGLIIVTVIVLGVIFGSKLLNKNSAKNHPLLYVENNQLLLVNHKHQKVVVNSDFNLDKNSSLSLAFMNNDINTIAYVDDDSLYLFNAKKDTKEKVSSNISDYSVMFFTDNDRYLVFSDSSDSLFAYDVKRKVKNKLIGSSSHYASTIYKGEEFIIYSDYKKIDNDKDDYSYDYEYSAYKVDYTGNNKEKIVSDYNYVEYDEEKDLLFYSKEKDGKNTYYQKKINSSKEEKVISNYYSKKGNNNYLVYTTDSTNKVDILNDDQFGKDPVTKKKLKCTFSRYYAGMCSFYDYFDDRSFIYKKDKKPINDSIREYNKEIKVFNLYLNKSGKDTLIANDIASIEYVNPDLDMICYRKIDFSAQQPVKISTLKTLEAFKTYLSKFKKALYCKVGNNPEQEVLEDTIDLDEVRSNNKNSVYYIIEKDEKLSLYYVDLTKEDSNELVDDDFSGFLNYSDLKYDSLLYYSRKFDDFYSLNKLKGSTYETIFNNVYNYVAKEGSLQFYSDCDDDSYSCSLVEYDGKNTKKIMDDLLVYIPLSGNNAFILKNYSEENETIDIYLLKNKKLINVAYNIDYDYIAY